jgi:hypothetical protein
MPMGIVSDSDYELELERLGIKKSTPNVDANRMPLPVRDVPSDSPIPETVGIVEDIKRGRGNTPEVPKIIRESVARAAIDGEGTGAEIAEAFGISPSSVSAYKVGATSTTTYDSPDDSLMSTIVGHRQGISKRARGTLLAALDEITPDTLKGIKARDLSAIAKDMSSIIVDMEPPIPAQPINQQNVQFVFMAPRVRSEDSYEIREVAD